MPCEWSFDFPHRRFLDRPHPASLAEFRLEPLAGDGHAAVSTEAPQKDEFGAGRGARLNAAMAGPGSSRHNDTL
jgi:hypothetical protein